MANDSFDSRSLEEYLQQVPLRRWLSSGGLLLIGLVIVVGLYTSYFTVEPQGKAVIKRFGRVVAIRNPGLHFKMPFRIDNAYFVPTERILKEEFGFRTVKAGQRTTYSRSAGTKQESLMLTGDLNVIDVEWVVQYRIDDPDKYLHRVRDARGTIRDVSEAVMRRIVGNRFGRDVLTVGRVDISAKAREKMQEILDDYEIGVHVEAVDLQDVTPPDPVKPAYNEVNEAQQEEKRLINEAERKLNQVIPKAKGEAEKTIAEAEAYRSERVNAAKGEATRFTSILHEYRQAKDVTRRRLFLEMIDKVIPQVGKLYVVEPSQNPPLALLNLNAAGTAAPARKQSTQRSQP